MRRFFINLIIVLVLASRIYAGGESDARAVGMARAQTAITENTEAYFWNPANLGLKANQDRRMANFFSIGFRTGNNVFSISQYNKYNGKNINDADKKDILGLFDGAKNLDANGDAELRFVGFQFQNFAFDLMFQGNGFARLPKSIFDVFFASNGYQFGSEPLNENGNGGYNLLMHLNGTAGFSLAKFFPGFKDFAGGVSLAYIHGFANTTLKDLNATLEQSDSIISTGRFRSLESSGGNGFATSLGVTAQLDDRWTVGLSGVNILSAISWSNNNKERTGEYSVRTDGVINLPDDLTTENDTIYNKAYTTKLPSILRLGVGYQASPTILLAADFEQFLNSANGHAVPRMAVGAEFHTTSKIFLRSGLSYGGDNRGFNLAGGAGFVMGNYRLDIGTNNLEGLVTQRRFSFALGLKKTM